ncbi:MAG: hypothetical protein M0P50_12175, partial [Bacteroidales bacterium]|nr:hypothetical protein [Bacteroidales bacterium]
MPKKNGYDQIRIQFIGTAQNDTADLQARELVRMGALHLILPNSLHLAASVISTEIFARLVWRESSI